MCLEGKSRSDHSQGKLTPRDIKRSLCLPNKDQMVVFKVPAPFKKFIMSAVTG